MSEDEPARAFELAAADFAALAPGCGTRWAASFGAAHGAAPRRAGPGRLLRCRRIGPPRRAGGGARGPGRRCGPGRRAAGAWPPAGRDRPKPAVHPRRRDGLAAGCGRAVRSGPVGLRGFVPAGHGCRRRAPGLAAATGRPVRGAGPGARVRSPRSRGGCLRPSPRRPAGHRSGPPRRSQPSASTPRPRSPTGCRRSASPAWPWPTCHSSCPRARPGLADCARDRMAVSAARFR
jgi:hypothetical protein